MTSVRVGSSLFVYKKPRTKELFQDSILLSLSGLDQVPKDSWLSTLNLTNKISRDVWAYLASGIRSPHLICEDVIDALSLLLNTKPHKYLIPLLRDESDDRLFEIYIYLYKNVVDSSFAQTRYFLADHLHLESATRTYACVLEAPRGKDRRLRPKSIATHTWRSKRLITERDQPTEPQQTDTLVTPPDGNNLNCHYKQTEFTSSQRQRVEQLIEKHFQPRHLAPST